MSSIGVAQAASARVPKTIINREQISTGFVAKMSIPKILDPGEYPDGDRKVQYQHFCRTIRGGAIHFFLHTDEVGMAFVGDFKSLAVAVTLMKKSYDDGSEMLYVDLVPTDKPVTHRLSVMPHSNGSWTGTDWPVFETPAPVQGLIILSPPDAKIIPFRGPMPVNTQKANEPVPPKKPSTGDGQLDRLLAAGWEIKSENGQKVILVKEKSGTTKTMTHLRPKPKTQPKTAKHRR